MPGLNKIEDYLISLGVSYEEPQAGTWLVEDAGKGLPAIMISIAEPVVILSAKAMRVPREGPRGLLLRAAQAQLFRLLHGAYAVHGDDVVLVDTLEYETLDKGGVRSLPRRDRLRPLGALPPVVQVYRQIMKAITKCGGIL